MPAGFIYFFQTSGDADWAPMHTALLQHGLGLRLYHDIDTLCTALANPAMADVSRLVILAGDYAAVYEATAAVRQVDPDVGVVALLPAVIESVVLQCLYSSVDVCWPSHTSVRQVASAVRRLLGKGRAHEPVAPTHSTNLSTWTLTSRAGVVQAPNGACVSLTTTERALMWALCEAPQRRLSHLEILRAIEQALCATPDSPKGHTGQPGRKGGVATARRLSVLMSRLRRKFISTGHDMPIRSVRGLGYELCADFNVSHGDAGHAAGPLPRREASVPSGP